MSKVLDKTLIAAGSHNNVSELTKGVEKGDKAVKLKFAEMEGVKELIKEVHPGLEAKELEKLKEWGKEHNTEKIEEIIANQKRIDKNLMEIKKILP